VIPVSDLDGDRVDRLAETLARMDDPEQIREYAELVVVGQHLRRELPVIMEGVRQETAKNICDRIESEFGDTAGGSDD